MRSTISKILLMLVIISLLSACKDHTTSSPINNKAITNNNNLNTEKIYTLHFLDVGKADCILIQSAEGKRANNIIIDSGDSNDSEFIYSYLKSLDITEIDALILTHGHSDHTGSADMLVRNFNVKSLFIHWAPDGEQDISNAFLYTDVIDAAKEKKLSISDFELNKQYEYGNMLLEFVGPVVWNSDDLNNNSIVTRIDLGSVSGLFTGDMSLAEESTLLAINPKILDVDILKVGHHGSSTSSSQSFLEYVSPEYSIVSVGEQNKAQEHPNEPIIKRLEEISNHLYRTDKDGTVIISIEDTSSDPTITVKFLNKKDIPSLVPPVPDFDFFSTIEKTINQNKDE